jgi:hypothetical protein
MPTPAGPYKTFVLAGDDVPLYLIPFDKEGACTAPQTRSHLLEALSTGGFTDVYLFSHGWNNDFETATGRYEHFMKGYAGQRQARGESYPRAYKPLLVGIVWPSTALVLPWEEPPAMAAAHGASAIDSLAEELPAAQAARAAELIARGDRLTLAEAKELAGMMAPLWNRFQHAGGNAVDMPVDAISPDELLELWRRQASEQAQGEGEEEDEFGGIAGGAPTGGPGAALSLGDIVGLPRDFARTFTVLQMKDRAVRVGGSGVSALLQDVLARSPARTHLLGHSYGCIVMLSALAAAPAAALPRKVDSVLLLQAAVSRYCFAAKVPQKDYPGGYRVDLGRVAQPVLATYSKRDGPLTSLFHLAVRRDADLGQPTIAGAPKAPSKYAALGGFGPDGCQDGECDYRAIHAVGQDYALGAGDPRIIALQADDAIKGHGDISVPETWWALYNQVRAS